MTADYCEHHSELVSSVGKLHGKMDMIIRGQEAISKDVGELYKKLNETDVVVAVEKTRIAPVYWVIGGVGLMIFNVGTAFVVALVVR